MELPDRSRSLLESENLSEALVLEQTVDELLATQSYLRHRGLGDEADDLAAVAARLITVADDIRERVSNL